MQENIGVSRSSILNWLDRTWSATKIPEMGVKLKKILPFMGTIFRFKVHEYDPKKHFLAQNIARDEYLDKLNNFF